jgi:hypothetical protein
MGLSQFAFLGLKTTASTNIQISNIYPLEGKPKQVLSIFGKNFGEERQVVWFGTERRMTSEDQEHLIFWSGDRIDIKIPEDVPPGDYRIMVVKGGLSKIAKYTFRVLPSPPPPPTASPPPKK